MGKKTFSIITFGCKVNAYESEAIKEKMIGLGYVFSKEPPADVIFVNTCAVTLEAEKKDMEKIRSLRRNDPSSEVIALGCFAQLHPEKLLGQGLKAIIGNKGRNDIEALLSGPEENCCVDKNSRLFAYEEQEISAFASSERAFCKIQDGCDNFCSYCIIPFTRGVSRSRKKEDVLMEITRLSLAGYKEIVLTGIDTGSYTDGETDFADLVEAILALPEKGFRLRIGSLEMSQISPKLISIMESNQRLVPHLHIPLQSGSEKILEAMGRKYDLEAFESLCRELKGRIKKLALSTDVICGFPGESEEDFSSTCAFVKKVGFMRLHCFPYSRRPFTKADKLPGQLDNGVKKERVRILSRIGQELAAGFLKEQEGQILTILAEEKKPGMDGNFIYSGYSENYLSLQVESSDNLLGKLIRGRVSFDGYIKDWEVVS